MSLGIVFKGAEGIVLAADSRVTLTTTRQHENRSEVTHAYYDNATKLLRIDEQKYVGAVAYGSGAIVGANGPRAIHSYLPEFESELAESKNGRLTVKEFAARLGRFFLRQWNAAQMPAEADSAIFVIGGYNQDSPYGEVYEVAVPVHPEPRLLQADGEFGITVGGQNEISQRLMGGFDMNLPAIAQEILGLVQEQKEKLSKGLTERLRPAIPFPFLPLQDSVDLAILIIRTTIAIQSLSLNLRGVGGPIDVATITRTEGFKYIQEKDVTGEKPE